MLAPAPPEGHSHNPLVRYFKLLGPGLVTGAADDDPSGITTYSVAGATLGLATLWTALATFPLMAAVQLISAATIRGASSTPPACSCSSPMSSTSAPISRGWPTRPRS